MSMYDDLIAQYGTPSETPAPAPASGDVVSLIHDAAQREGVGEYAPLLVALAKTESSLDPRAQNPSSSAGGLFQFIDDTARRYGVTDKFDPQQSAQAAARMFRENLQRFGGDVKLALAAHHVGPGKARQALTDTSVGDIDVSTQEWLDRVLGSAGGEASQSRPPRVSRERDEFLTDTRGVLEQRDRQDAADESPLSTSLGRGWEGLKHNAGLMVDNALGDSQGVAERIQYKRAWDEENPAPRSSQAFIEQFQNLDDDDLTGVLTAALQNPTGAFNQMVEQTPNSLPGLALQVPVMFATGALMATGWGAPLAMALQGAAAFVGNVLPEGGAFIEEEFAKSGIDPNDADAVTQWAIEHRGENLKGGATKAGMISAVDGVTGYLGAKLLAGPAARFSAMDRSLVRKAGIDPTNKAAVSALRASPAYKQAMAQPAQDLLAATTGVQKVGRALGSFGLESAGEGVGEYAGTYAATGEASGKEAMLEGLMGGGTSAIMTGAQSAMAALQGPDAQRAELEKLAATPPQPQPVMHPNAPLTNAANIASSNAATVDPAAAFGADPNIAEGAPGATEETPSDDPLAERIAKVASFVEDKTFQRTMRDAEGYGKESVNEALRAFVVARNPNTDPLMRERALTELEQFIDAFARRPNFILGGQQAAQPGTDVVPAQPHGTPAATPQLEAPAFPERDITPQPDAPIADPSRLLETEQALLAKRDADAAYEQAYLDLLKAEELGAADADLMAYQQALDEARAQQVAMDVRLQEIREQVAAGRAQQGAEARRAVLDAVLADPATVNPAERFAAELNRQGFRDSSPTADEAATIERFEAVRAAEAAPEVEPSAPNELDPYVSAGLSSKTTKTAQSVQSGESGKAVNQDALSLLDAGWRLVGKTLQHPKSGKRRILNARELDEVRARNFAAADAAQAQPTQSPTAAEQSRPAPGQRSEPAQPTLPADDLEAWATKRAQEIIAAGGRVVTDNGKLTVIRANGEPAEVAHLSKEMAEMLDRQQAEKDAAAAREQAEQAEREAQAQREVEAQAKREQAAQAAAEQARVDEAAERERLKAIPVGVGDTFQFKGRTFQLDALPGADNDGRGQAHEVTVWRDGSITPVGEQQYHFDPAQFEQMTGRRLKAEEPAPADAGVAALHDAVAEAEAATATAPTDGQKEAGNYAKGKVDLHGQRISIETPKGTERSGIGEDGQRWSVTMPASYGYFLGTEANDGDHVDVFIGPKPEAGLFWVVNQVKPDSASYDEPKVMLGYESADAAQADYLLSFSGDFGGRVFGEMVGPFSVADLARMLPKMRRNHPVDGEVAIEGRFQAEPAPEIPNGDGITRAESVMHENATAPEHVKVETGVTVDELKQIAAAFREHIDSGGDADVTHVFDAPAKTDIVNLEKKAGVTAKNVGGKRVYHREAGWLSAEEAKAKIAEWKENARQQGESRANSDKVVLSLFDLSGEWSKPWEEAGYQVFRFDIQDDPVLGDVNNFSTEFFNDWFSDFDGMDVYAILAANPCTDFASSGSRHFAAKDADGRTVSSVRLVNKTLAAIEYFKPAVWALENPVGRIESLTGLPPWRLSFDPYHLGDTYTKKTLIWGRFNGDLPVAPVEPVEGSKMHTQYGGKSQATKNARSVTPEGFAYAFFDANNAIDHPAMAVANKFDRLDRELIGKAIDAGVTPDEIESAVEDFYYMDLDDDAANAAIRALLPAPTSDPSKPDGEKDRAPEQLRLDIPEPKNWRTSYGTAQKYAEALGVNPRGEDGKYLKLPALVAAIEAKRGEAQAAPVADAAPDMEKYILVAADSISELRKADVYRLLVESNRPEIRDDLAAYIKTKRPDLAAEVDAVMAEAGDGKATESQSIAESMETAVARKLRQIADEVERQGTDNGRRSLDERWAEGAIKRMMDAKSLTAMMSGKQYGALASAKIALSKDRLTVAGLRKIADKLAAPIEAAQDVVKTFGVAMRGLGMEMDGVDPRSWSVDLASGHEVHARLSPSSREVSIDRFEGGEVVASATVETSADATRTVEEYIRAAMKAPAVDPLYPAGHSFVGDGGDVWTFAEPVMPGDKTVQVEVAKADGTPANAARMFSLGYVESEMRVGREWQAEQAREQAAKASAPRETVEPDSLDAMRAALEAGKKAHFDYAGAHGRTLWIEETAKGWVVKSQDDDSDGVITSGGAGAGGSWSQERAIDKALQDAEYRFTQWKPAAEQQGAVDQILADKVATLTERGVPQSQIEQAVAEYKDGDATLVDDLLRISQPEANAPADADIDLDALFDEVLAEETAAKPKREKKAKAPKVEPSEAVKKAAARVRIIPGTPESPAFIVKDPEGNGNNGITLASFEIGATGRPVKVKHYYDHTRDYAQLAIDQWMAANKPSAAASKPKAPRKAGAAAKSAAQNTAAGFADAIAGLGKLFGGHGRLSSGLTFDEDTYAKAKPLFKQAIAHFGDAAADVRDVMRAVVRAVLDQFGEHVAGNMKPYIVRFVEDVRTGKIDYDESVEDAQGANDEPAGNDRGDESALAPVSPGELQDAEGRGEAGQGGGGLRGPDADGDGSAAEDARDDGDRGVARESDPVLPEGSDQLEQVEIAGEPRPLDEVAEVVKNDAPASEPKPRFPPRFGNNPGNYTITDADAIGTGTTGERIRANMAAVRLVLELEHDNRYPTRDEQSVLAKYVGWGGLKNVFKGDNSTSKQERDAHAELKRILTPEQLFWMGQSVLDAHYTSPKIVRAMYRVLQHFGVEGGRFLEPTVGVGNFIGLMPTELAASAKWYGAEIDPITSLIAKHLYPEAQILPATGFQDAEFAYGRMDVAIGNPPFGDQRITDTNKKRADINGFKIHNYIISKSAMHLRPGGVMAFVVTSRFLDTANPEAREYLAKNFRLLGAIRLPNTAFAENAGTEVTTDVIFLQRMRGEQREGVGADDMPWLDTKGRMLNEDGETVTMNRYFAENPHLMLGKPSMQGTMYGSRTEKGEFTLMPRPGMDVDAEIDKILAGDWMPLKGVARPRAKDLEVAAAEVVFNREDVPIGGFFQEGVRVVQRIDDDADGNVLFRELTPETPWTEKQTLGATRLGRIKGMLKLREMAYALMADERADAAAEHLEAKRAELNREYDAFVEEYGFLNDNANKSLMNDDPRIEFGLESDYTKAITAAAAKRLGQKPAPAKASKSSLLRERVFFQKQEVESADTPADGYAISLSEKGRLDLDYISELTGLNVEQVIADLSSGSAPLIFKDPTLNRWVQEDEYLSGNVKDKLKAARGAGLEANVRALEAVQPADVAAADIHPEFGATWIAQSIYEDFLKLLGYQSAQVAVMPKSGAVEAIQTGSLGASLFRSDIENPDYSIAEVFSAAANRRQLVAYDGRGDDRVMNQERTENLGRIRNKLIAIWRDWIKADPERAALLERDYNEIMNTTVERQYDGVKHLRTVGANPLIELRNSQKDSAWRMIQSSVSLLDHVVGAGKTIALTTGIMERKRLGLSQKPVVIVPNHLVGQWARDWMLLYPGANILAATEKDFQKANRRRLFARIATGKFDAIIVGHSSFGFIPVSREAEVKFVMGEIEHLEDALTEARHADGGKGKKGDSRRVRAIKNRIAKRMEKIRELQDKPRDNVVTFEDMGIDYLAVDELHEFKNLEYATTLTNVAGMGSPEGSKKAFDLYMKMRLLQEAGGGVAGATGTPLSNSMVEMYSLLRYLNPGALAARGMEQFDAWVKAFASIEPRDEYTAAGKIKQRTVLAAFNNLPELLQMYKQVADTVTMSDLKRIYAAQIREENARKGTKKREEFPVPKVAGGGRRLDIGEPTEEQVEFMDYLIARADILDKKKGKDKQAYAKTDNALWLMNDARKMSLDVRIIDPTVPDNPGNKVNRAAKNIKATYDKWDSDLGAQLVFCDLSTPAKNATKDAAAFIKTALKALGLESDAAIIAALENKSYVDKWSFLELRAEMMIESGALDDAKRERIETFLEKVTDDERSSLQVADTGFSVYDALKDKLIESGIPAREIAFIHDANTADQKKELFDLVNAGKVRVLIGSSAKMGAGTNAQKRLVALHHMDAPWRPSDIEQREGRIIRQGNMLYERDPEGFEVDIVAYSTERTFDAQMWGVLARKAAFLEQFRSGLRTIKEEGSDAASYAEFMAEATGDQIFREKLHLEREMVDLEAEDRSAKMKRAGAEQLVATGDEKLAKLESKLKKMRALAEADLSSVTFERKTYRNDIAEVLESEMALYREEYAQFEQAEEAYKIARKAWEDAAGTDRGRAPAKPKAPEVPEVGSERVEAQSEWARLVNLLTKQMEMLSTGDNDRYTLVAANGAEIEIEASRRGDSSERSLFIAGEWVGSSAARGPYIASRLLPHRLLGELRGRPDRVERDLRSLRTNIEQAQVTLDHVKPIDPQRIEDLRARYEAVKKAVDEVSARMAEERAQRANRFIARDKRRFAGAAAAGAVAQEMGVPSRREAGGNVAADAVSQDEPTVTEAMRFRRVGGAVQLESGVKDVELPGLEAFTFFAVNDKGAREWYIIETMTGLSIGKGKTRSAALAAAVATAERIGPAKVAEVIGNNAAITDDEKRAAVAKAVPSVLSRRTADADDVAGIGVVEAETALAAFLARTPLAPRVEVKDRFEDLPQQVQADARAQDSDEKTTKGAFHNGVLYVVRGNHRSVADFEATIAHEMLGHFGLRRELGPEFVQRSNQLFLQIGGLNGLAEIARKYDFDKTFAGYVRGAAEARRRDPQRFTEQIVKLILTEEVYAHLAERRGGAWVKLRELIGRLRHWLRERGFMKLPNLNDADLLAHLGRIEDVLAGRRPPGGDGPRGGGKAPAVLKRGDDAIMASRKPKIDTTNRRTALFTALAQFDEAFQLPTPKGTTLEAVAREIDPDYRAKAMPELFASSKTNGLATKAWEISVPKSDIRVGYVFEDARGRVWLDVSQLRPGIDTGNVVYAAVSGYAHNAGKVFIGDPAGLSPMAFFRRLENMISSALRYGTTDHLYPHAAQMDPAAYYTSAMDYPDFARDTKGLGLDWKDGDFSHNLSEMMRVSYNAAIRFAPELRDVIYDFDVRQFVDAATGERRSRAAFEDVSRRLRAQAGARYLGGSSTLARAALVNTLVQRSGKEDWRATMVALGDQLRGRGLDLELERIFYARKEQSATGGLTADQFRAALIERFGEAGVASLEAQGLLNVLETDPDDLVAQAHMSPDNPAFYDPNTGEAFFVPEFIESADEAVRLVLHEVGEHHGLESMLGAKGWQTLKARVVTLASETKSEAAEAWIYVLDTYPEFAKYAQDPAGAAADDRFMHEVIAKLGESAAGRKSSLWRDLLAAVNRFLLKMGLGRQINKAELADLVAGSLARVMGGKAAQRSGKGGVMFSRRPRSTDNWIDSPASVLPEALRAAPGRAVGALADVLPQKAGDYLHYLFDGATAKTFNWYHKTIGSQFHKAKVDPQHYGRVVKTAQQFIEDVARFGTESADKAPDLLPKMDTIAAALRETKNFRRDSADAKAIAAPIFDGTLYEENGEIVGKVWTPAELRDQYGLNERQIGLYFQFRDAVDHSLEQLAIAEMTKVAKAYAEPKQPGDPVLLPPASPLGMDALAKHYADQFVDRLKAARKKLAETMAQIARDREQLAQNAISLDVGRVGYHEMMVKKDAEDAATVAAIQKEIDELAKLRNAFEGKAATIRKLKNDGYAPLMRFGKFTVDVVQMRDATDEDGNPIVDRETGEIKQEEYRPYFGMYESEREAQQDAALMREMYPDAQVTTGVGSQDGYQLFGSVSLDSLEMLAKLAGAEEDAFVQKFYKEAVAQRSALKRLIHRKGTAGYSQDVTRSLAAFLMSNARATASAYHFGDLMKVAADIPKEKGDVKDEAVRLINYIRDPNEEAGWMRGLLFMHFLGGSVAAAAVNLTQSMTTTAPFLHQFGVGVADMTAAARDAGRRMGGKAIPDASKALNDALARAEREGVVAPHNVHALMGQSGTQSFMNHRVFRLFSHVWGSMFGMAEQFNREVAFIAAFRAAEKMGRTGMQEAYARAVDVARSRGLEAPDRATFSDPFEFAKNAVNETQFVLSKAARPNWARGAVGATLFTFRQFMVNYLELFKRLPNKERALMLGTLIVLAGVGGLPGADDLDDLIDTLGQSMGYNTNSERWREELAREVFGKEGGEFVTRGVSAFIPLELASRLGMGNLIPGTGVFKPSNVGNRDRETAEFFGAAGGYYKALFEAADYFQRGRYIQGFTNAALPKAFKDLAKGVEMAQTGVYDDSRGRRVVDVDGVDAFVKAIGFQPTAVSSVQRAKGMAMQEVALFKAVKANIAEMLAQAIYERDTDKRARALDLLADWNRKNPEQRMKRPEATSIARRVRAMQLSAADRMNKTTPKELRGRMMADVEG